VQSFKIGQYFTKSRRTKNCAIFGTPCRIWVTAYTTSRNKVTVCKFSHYADSSLWYHLIIIIIIIIIIHYVGSNTNTSTSTKRNKALTCAHRSELEICCSRTCASRHMLQPSPSNAMLLISTNVLPLKRKRRTDGDENAFENLCRWWSRILQSCRQNWTLQKEITTT